MTTNSLKPTRARVLLVDDEPDVTRSLKLNLRRNRWDIKTATSGEEALELCRAEAFDVVVSDERMPGMQGSDLLSIVRQEHPNTIRITLSGQASLERAIHAINSAEIHRFLLKPCPPNEVALAIEELLEKRRERLVREHSREEAESMEAASSTAAFEEALRSLWMGFQPILNREGTLFGYEALMRTDSAVIPNPGELFDVAESLGRSMELGAITRDAVAERIPFAPEGATILVNVNPDHLADDGLYDADAALSKFSSRVVIEVTERSSAADSENVAEKMEWLTNLGFRVAVDDLGAGYSGLNSFALLSPSIVKFDMEMIRNIHHSPTKQAVVGAMTSLCRGLDIRTIAEGVETMEEYSMAHSLGCDLFQGFLLGRAQRSFMQPSIKSAA